jgi:uncharacterized protein (DUF1501 family)
MQTRRQFLRGTLGGPLLLSLAPSAPLFLARAAERAAALPSSGERVLVVLQLSGGNDGLNTVVPFTDDAYGRKRPTLRLPSAELRKISPQLALHPRMAGFERLFKDGRLAIVQGVGCPGLSRDHEVALRTWQAGAPARRDGSPYLVDTGWVGRATDYLGSRARPAAAGVFVGEIPRPFGINAASAVVPALHAGRDFKLDWAGETPEGTGGLEVGAASQPSVLLRHVRSSLTLAREHARRLANVAPAAAAYPAGGLGEDLRTIARLIRAEIGLRIVYAELGGGDIGGFDNHANQIGNHCALLQQLSDSVAAFAADLAADGLLERVVLLTFSEFGRTVAENGRRGTDHGAAAPMFLVGGKVRGGIHGAPPSLTDLEGDALKHHTDFRAVYATVLDHWLGLPSADILHGKFERLELLA